MGRALILLFLFTSFSVQAMTEAPAIVEALSRPETYMQYGHRDRREWTEADGTTNLLESFNTWKTCHEARVSGQTLPEICYCGQQNESPVKELNFIGLHSCIPDQLDRTIAYSADLTDSQRRERDELICNCMRDGRSFDAIGSTPPTKRDVQQIGTEIQSRLQHAGLSRSEELEFQMKYSTAVNVMNLADTSGRAERLGGVYIAENRRVSRSRNKSGRMNLEGTIERLLDRNNVSGTQCIPYSDFLLHAQFSEDPNIIGSPGIITGAFDVPFKEEDWDYRKLLEKLKGSQTYEAARIAAPGNEYILSRMRFLNDNPTFKNLFASNDQNSGAKKRELFNLLKNHYPRPSCADILCTRNDEWARQVGPFRRKISEFLSQDDVNDDIQTGIERMSELSEAAQEAHVAFQAETPFSENLGNDPLTAGGNSWRAFCQLRNNPERRRQRENDGNLALLVDIENEFGRNFVSPMEDEHFRKVNAAYCERPRRSDSGALMKFTDFKATCGSMDHRACLTAFIRAYPAPTPVTPGGLPELDTFINDIYLRPGVLSPEIKREQINRVVAIGNSPELRRSSFQELSTGNYPASGGFDRPMRAPASVAIASSGQTSTPQLQSQQAQLQSGTMFNSTPAPEIQVPLAAGQAAAIQVPRSQATEKSQTKVNDLSAELDGLRAQIAQRRDNAENPELASLRSRYTLVEEALRKAQDRLAENERLDAERRSAANAEDNDDDDDSEDTPRRARRVSRTSSGSVAANSVAAASVTPQAAQAASTALAPASALNSGGGSASLSAGSTRQAARSTTTSQSRTATSANGSADSGAITVASNSVAEYEQVRAEAAVNQISEAASPEVLSQIERGDASFLEQYRQRIEAFPGKYVLLDLGDLEFVVAKNGEQLSLMSKDGRFIASDARPEPVRERTESEREHTLRALQNNLSQ